MRRIRRLTALALMIWLIFVGPATAATIVSDPLSALQYGNGTSWTNVLPIGGVFAFTLPAGYTLRAVVSLPIPNGSAWHADYAGEDWQTNISGGINGIGNGSSYAIFSPPFSGTMGYNLSYLVLTYVAPLPVSVPSVPSGLSLGTVTETSAVLKWSPASGASSYDVYLDGDLVASDITATTYTFSDLSAGSDHTAQLRSVNSVGPSELTTKLAFSTQSAPVLSPPSNVTQSGTPGGTGIISWSPGSNTPSGTNYTVYENGQVIGSTSSSPYQVQNYDPNAVYTVVAQATNYQASKPSSQADRQYSAALALGFTPVDLVRNAVALIWGIGSLLLLALTLMFAPRLLRFIRRSESDDEWGSDYEDITGRERDWTVNTVPVKPLNMDRLPRAAPVSTNMEPRRKEVVYPSYDFHVSDDWNDE